MDYHNIHSMIKKAQRGKYYRDLMSNWGNEIVKDGKYYRDLMSNWGNEIVKDLNDPASIPANWEEIRRTDPKLHRRLTTYIPGLRPVLNMARSGEAAGEGRYGAALGNAALAVADLYSQALVGQMGLQGAGALRGAAGRTVGSVRNINTVSREAAKRFDIPVAEARKLAVREFAKSKGRAAGASVGRAAASGAQAAKGAVQGGVKATAARAGSAVASGAKAAPKHLLSTVNPTTRVGAITTQAYMPQVENLQGTLKLQRDVRSHISDSNKQQRRDEQLAIAKHNKRQREAAAAKNAPISIPRKDISQYVLSGGAGAALGGGLGYLLSVLHGDEKKRRRRAALYSTLGAVAGLAGGAYKEYRGRNAQPK